MQAAFRGLAHDDVNGVICTIGRAVMFGLGTSLRPSIATMADGTCSTRLSGERSPLAPTYRSLRPLAHDPVGDEHLWRVYSAFRAFNLSGGMGDVNWLVAGTLHGHSADLIVLRLVEERSGV